MINLTNETSRGTRHLAVAGRSQETWHNPVREGLQIWVTLRPEYASA
jgi:hypothetical protein